MDALSRLTRSHILSDKRPTLPGLRLISELGAQQAATAGTTTLQTQTNQDPKRQHQGSSNTNSTELVTPLRKICAKWYHGACTNDGSSPENTCRFLHQIEGSSSRLTWQKPSTHPCSCGLELCPFKDGLPKSRLICAYWYHGACTKDGSTSGNTCKFLHQMEGSHMKITPQKPAHEVPCGLELCPLKEDSAKARQAQSRSSDSSTYDDAVRASQSAGNDSSAQQSISAGATKKSKKRNHKNKIKTAQEPVLVEEGRRNSTTGPINTNITYQLELSNTDRKGDKKRKCAYRHPDQPVKRRRTDLDYDDDISNGANIVKDRTCFFWYHGWCPKESDAARGLGPPCDYRHSLTDRPTMVQYPPRDHHGGIACGKQWCPIGRDATSEHQYTSSLAGHQARESSSEPSTPGEGKGEGEGEGSGNPDSDTTCFFWYHGSCARSKDPRNGHRCGFLHALTDPPTMVQPPPGYKHRTHCERDWCPGDARERFTTLKDAPTVGEQQSPEDAAGQGKAARDEAQQPDWFLKGFDW